MHKDTFLKLLRVLTVHGQLSDRRMISAGEKLMIFMNLLTNSSIRKLAERWQHSISTISVVNDKVKESLLKIKNQFMRNKTPNDPIPYRYITIQKFSHTSKIVGKNRRWARPFSMAGGSYYSYVESNLKSPVGFCSF
jgi:hypothetical protein